jgi:thiamine pyrophosphokinase
MTAAARTDQTGEKRGLLVVGGDAPSPQALREAARGVELVTAADSGLLRVLEAGLVPDLVVGDMDSLPDRSLLERVARERVFIFPVDKDETDTEIGMRMMRERGCTDIAIAGGGGGRIDHLLGVALLFEREDPPSRWLTDAADIYMVDGERLFSGWEGSTVSVFPLGPRAGEMSSEGLRWPLDGLTFQRGWGGISNVATASRVRISVGMGRLLVVRSLVKDP